MTEDGELTRAQRIRVRTLLLIRSGEASRLARREFSTGTAIDGDFRAEFPSRVAAAVRNLLPRCSRPAMPRTPVGVMLVCPA